MLVVKIRKNVEIPKTQTVIDANDKLQYLLPARHVHLGDSHEPSYSESN